MGQGGSEEGADGDRSAAVPGPVPGRPGEVECDEVYVVAGQKGNPEAVKKKGESGVGGG